MCTDNGKLPDCSMLMCMEMSCGAMCKDANDCSDVWPSDGNLDQASLSGCMVYVVHLVFRFGEHACVPIGLQVSALLVVYGRRMGLLI